MGMKIHILCAISLVSALLARADPKEEAGRYQLVAKLCDPTPDKNSALQSLQSDYVQRNMNRISASTWAEIRTAYASGIGLREIARNMGIPAGTVLARSKREGGRSKSQPPNCQRPEMAKPDAIDAITPMQSAAISAQERKQGLFSKAIRIADKAADRMEDQIGTANISQATIAFGVSTEKALLLAGEPLRASLDLQISAPNILSEFKAIVEQMQANARALPDVDAQLVECTPVAGDGCVDGPVALRPRGKK